MRARWTISHRPNRQVACAYPTDSWSLNCGKTDPYQSSDGNASHHSRRKIALAVPNVSLRALLMPLLAQANVCTPFYRPMHRLWAVVCHPVQWTALSWCLTRVMDDATRQTEQDGLRALLRPPWPYRTPSQWQHQCQTCGQYGTSQTQWDIKVVDIDETATKNAIEAANYQIKKLEPNNLPYADDNKQALVQTLQQQLATLP